MKLEKEEQMRPKVSRRRDIIKIKAEINKIEKNVYPVAFGWSVM